uniref:(R,S)-reticuline 7-O-methyltransferase-like n=1 Tax=Nicotiana tabacum TaxID=4097 RepID=A0A1S3Z7S9_TOBAC|nr:PREDICTED: (R,S)-reticuline 7-O-methyltransferase-like [Nicotiana tabacum]
MGFSRESPSKMFPASQFPSEIRWVMHDWGDEDCVKILTNCRKAIPEKTGKVIIVDAVLKSEGEGLFDDMGFILDLLMIAHSSGGKERSENEWKILLKEAGFPVFHVIILLRFLLGLLVLKPMHSDL